MFTVAPYKYKLRYRESQWVIFSVASVAILLIWLAIGVLEKLQKQSQDRDQKLTETEEQNIPLSS